MMNQDQFDFFFADTCGQKVKIKFSSLAFVESAGNYVLLTGCNFRTMVYSSMNRMMDLLEDRRFIRIHKSYTVSIDHIEAIKGNECMMDLSGKKVGLPIGVTYKKEVFKRLGIDR
ncbi:MAG TPA: LytTR family DNA-binding domain-containing protein [Bacteroidia bacterium]|nr:LytTR family DNA-binding domain-containing protein [Bacteroidia bacterium]